ncbi:hypothetical protein CAEBREN_13688 [Caenorhabditis brenneri]|uniref:G-protein coupled receptors family 1 profile domain-containing protein n=1 Tax=Caenorhabditis brenneri TaxID=135651 RepID=G0M9S3_CAEBE|nr:hypothetical protein CAEBREN_13688 [Caenorhabditis brenneri]
MSPPYSATDFDEYTKSSQSVLLNIGNYLSELSDNFIQFQLFFACIGFVVNIFHLTVLTRKSMRTSSINVIMIGISICDLCNMVFMIKYDIVMFSENECSPPKTYTNEIFNLWISAAEDTTRRLITWFGFLLASLRFFIVKNSLKPKYHHFSKPLFATKVMISMTIISVIMSVFYYGRGCFKVVDEWAPPKHCDGFPLNFTTPVYEVVIENMALSEDSPALKTLSIVDGLLKLIASCTLPIFTYLLMIEHRNAKNSKLQFSTRSRSSRSDHTTKLVILMTITFIISESPFGIIYFVEGIVLNSPGIVHLTTDLIDLFGIFLAINSITSCLICLVVSSQYRRAVEKLIGMKKKNSNSRSSRVNVTSCAVIGKSEMKI